MPKLRPTPEQRECNRFSDFVRGELKRQGKQQQDLADCLRLTRTAVTKKINGKAAWSLSDIVQTLEFLNSSYVIGG